MQVGGRSGALRGETRRASEIDVRTRDAMWSLFERYYADVRREVFERDLSSKQYVILLLDEGDESVQGFSTVQVYRRVIDGRPVQIVFSGDTVIERTYWGQGVVQRAYAALFLRVKLERPSEPLYYFLLSKGYKTYLLLTRSYPEHWPRHDRETPTHVRTILDTLSREKFGELYDAHSGVVRVQSAEGRLREDVAPIHDGLMADPDIRFFAKINPGYVQAHELCCIAPVTWLTPVRYVVSRGARAISSRLRAPTPERRR
ncbi:hypothetical protein [Sandaracinus amylolyticus]|uniref:hypothetical protein n=1 Tax=Sandaracinus amylolyticus TaxID=927083 RepID=UPI001F48F265|nr:hypothetical protein [Sandaracinus amylolyticus]UJR82583.1 Hypothetical protein I5071_46480 [Sandaracinus amylolyticus]